MKKILSVFYALSTMFLLAACGTKATGDQFDQSTLPIPTKKGALLVVYKAPRSIQVSRDFDLEINGKKCLLPDEGFIISKVTPGLININVGTWDLLTTHAKINLAPGTITYVRADYNRGQMLANSFGVIGVLLSDEQIWQQDGQFKLLVVASHEAEKELVNSREATCK